MEATATQQPPATATATLVQTPMPNVPVYAAGIQWTDINGDKHLFMYEDPPMGQYSVDLEAWVAEIPNTGQTITALHFGPRRGSILVGIWLYIHEDADHMLIDIAAVAVNDFGTMVNMEIQILGQTAKTFEMTQLQFGKDLIGTETEMLPTGDCELLLSDPDGNSVETDGTSQFSAFICQPPDELIG